MRRLATIRALLVLVVLAGALVMGSALPAAAQEAPTGTVHIRQQARLVAGGAAIRVPIRYSCSPDTAYAEIDVQVTQRVGGNRLAQGFGFTQDLRCDGQVHTGVVTVTAFGDNAFRRGGAFAQATVTLCNEVACTELRTSRDITIVRR